MMSAVVLQKLADVRIMLSNRMLSTYLNTLTGDGFILKKIVERGDAALLGADGNLFSKKAKIVSVSFAIKAGKKG